MTEGYLHCFSNQSMPGILKVSMTEKTPEITLNEANSSSYKIEFAKKVLNPKQKETTIHNLLSQYTERINPPECDFFHLIDGDLWVKNDAKEDSQSIISSSAIGCRDMSKCFTNDNKTWIGLYDSLKNRISYDMKFYKSLSGFAAMHYSK